MRKSLAFLGVLSLLATSACGFYFGDDSDDDCLYGGNGSTPSGGAAVPAVGQRDPYSGQCQYFGGGDPNPYPCDNPCGPCPADTGDAAGEPAPTWGFCESQCTGLDETSCLGASGCRAIYADSDQGLAYLDCWSTDMTGPIQGGGCDGLDAYACSLHDDCAAVHHSTCDGTGFADPGCQATDFVRCTPEPAGCLGDQDCGDGFHCQLPDVCPNNCAPDSPTCDPLPCYGTCEPNTTDAGQCYGDVTCTSDPPDCPVDTMPGIKDGCFTGYCIPISQCESQPACSTITVEATCVARTDCNPLYEGVDCSCDANGCTCADWLFDHCE